MALSSRRVSFHHSGSSSSDSHGLPSAPSSSGAFAALLDQAFGMQGLEGRVVPARVVAVQDSGVVLDFGGKSEARVGLHEFAPAGQTPEIAVGDTVDVYVLRMEGINGEPVVSRSKAVVEARWIDLAKLAEANERITGFILAVVRGGYTVDVGGVMAFLPGSQVDIRPVRDIAPLLGTPQPFRILKMDRARSNIVISRRVVLEESRAEARSELIGRLEEGQILDGVVKNLTDYGAFVDLGGVDGLLHVTDIAWRRINHPSEVLQIGQEVKVQIIRFNAETQRISLGMKQLEADPWEGISQRYPSGSRFSGRVTNITDYGVFVEIEPGIEGLIHVSEMSWTRKNLHPSKTVTIGQDVEVMVLDVDSTKRRVSLGMKQCLPNPWEQFRDSHAVGSTLSGEIRNITEFGLFVALPGEIDGMVHLSDLAWDQAGEDALKNYTKGHVIEVKVLDVDADKERISLGVKQLTEAPAASTASESVADGESPSPAALKKGAVVTCVIASLTDAGLEVTFGDHAVGYTGFIKRNDLARERSEQRIDRFAVGEKVDAKVILVDKANQRVTLSIRAREIEEDKKAMAEYGSSDSGASLGDILGAAMKKAQKQTEDTEA